MSTHPIIESAELFNRRALLRGTMGGVGAAALGSLLSREALAGEGPLLQATHFPATAKRVIYLHMSGAPSQIDTFDYKPELRKYAGKTLPPDKKYINSGGRKVGYLTPNWREFRPGGQSGLLISDYFPKVREHADKLAVIRSCHADSHAHGSALVQMNTGMPLIGRPSLGSWVSYGLGSENDSLPAHVVILDKRGGPISGQPNWSSGFMPATYQGTLFRPAGSPVLDLKGPAHLDRKAQRNQLDFLARLNQQHLDARPGGEELAARIQSYELAYRMQVHAPEVLNLAGETKETQQRYGIETTATDDFGKQCLLARRMCEAGVRFVQINYSDNAATPRWDQHSNLKKHETHAMATDQPVAALLADLKARGLLEDTLVWWGGEFGRPPGTSLKSRPRVPGGGGGPRL